MALIVLSLNNISNSATKQKKDPCGSWNEDSMTCLFLLFPCPILLAPFRNMARWTCDCCTRSFMFP